jgi:hypothetical protein
LAFSEADTLLDDDQHDEEQTQVPTCAHSRSKLCKKSFPIIDIDAE